MTKERERLLRKWDYCERAITYCDEKMKEARRMAENAQDEHDYNAGCDRWAFYFDLKNAAQALQDETNDSINDYDMMKGGD